MGTSTTFFPRRSDLIESIPLSTLVTELLPNPKWSHTQRLTHLPRTPFLSIRFQSSCLQKQSSNTSTYIQSTKLECLPKQLQRNLPRPQKPLQPQKHTLPKFPRLAPRRKRPLSLPKRRSARIVRKLGVVTFTKVITHDPWCFFLFSFFALELARTFRVPEGG